MQELICRVECISELGECERASLESSLSDVPALETMTYICRIAGGLGSSLLVMPVRDGVVTSGVGWSELLDEAIFGQTAGQSGAQWANMAESGVKNLEDFQLC